MSESSAEPSKEDPRPDIVKLGEKRLSRTERWLIAFVRRTFEPGLVDRVIRRCQRAVGSTWIHHCTKYLRHVYGIERLPKLDPKQSFLLVCNHRSFFDLYVVIGELVRRGLPQRIVFPVRSNFFYTSLLGLFVNGVMSFFAMYPPIFRERKQAALNVASLDELTWLLRRGGVFAGLHPEGTRKRDDDPYTLLPAQRGVGRIIRDAAVPVIPVFINGLINDLPEQVKSNFARTGRKIVVVFGEPIDFGDLMSAPSTPKVHQAIADRALEVVAALGAEERLHRAELEAETAGLPLPSR
ncbi:MAG TPA: lysophospholipid acyltransferase family protein [Polyangiaceae bacterium]|nr:lysophospholipid acyltransferase family protein [Polyangiaceae bacterium]